MNIQLKSYNQFLLKLAFHKISRLLMIMDIPYKTHFVNNGPKLYTILKSPHVDKRARHQYHLHEYQLNFIFYSLIDQDLAKLLLMPGNTIPGISYYITFYLDAK